MVSALWNGVSGLNTFEKAINVESNNVTWGMSLICTLGPMHPTHWLDVFNSIWQKGGDYTNSLVTDFLSFDNASGSSKGRKEEGHRQWKK